MKEERVIRFLRGGAAWLTTAAQPNTVLMENGTGEAIAVPSTTVRGLLESGAVVAEGGALRLSARLGRAKQGNACEAEPARQPRDVQPARIEAPEGGATEVLVNHGESPLAVLMRRKTKAGAPFLTQSEFGAGERLRADFTRGALMPRTGMNWAAPVASGKRGSGGGIGELTDAALGARLRVERALVAVGPELSGVLVDVCCFLKGLEQVEAERGWPVRSAKVVLKAALAMLARHYDPGSGEDRERRGAILRWGADGYRPEEL